MTMGKPWWQHEAAIAWALILFFPLGLLMMWRYAPWRNRFKWLLTAVTLILPLLFVAGAITGATQETHNSSTNAGVSAGLGKQTEPTQGGAPVSPEVASAEPTATPKPPKISNTAPLAIGAVAEAKGIRITIVDILDPSPCTWTDPGMRCVAFQLMAQNVSDSPVNVMVGSFHLTDNEEFQYDSAAFGPAPELDTFKLRPGSKTQGFVSFQPRQDALLRELYYDPDIHFLAQ